MTIGFGEQGWGGVLVSGGGGGGGGSGPVVTNFIPTKDTPISPATPLTFDVVSANALAAIVIYIDYGDTGAVEVAYSAQGFALNYRPFDTFIGSERQPNTGYVHYILRRRGGWFATPTVRAEGADVNGGAIVVTP